ncbi:MAG TPA: hypothetical protein VNJ52_07880 [Patescibacteria group bacterium]|nr:hypothetical protein [Patescibacteria group bacterium]
MRGNKLRRSLRTIDSKKQAKACGDDEAVTSRAVDISVAWVMEDVEAVAESLGVELGELLRDILERLKEEAALLGLEHASAPGDESAVH